MNRFDPARRTILKATAAAGGAVAVPLAATVEAAAPAASPSAANTAAASTMNVTLRVNGREHKLTVDPRTPVSALSVAEQQLVERRGRQHRPRRGCRESVG